MKMNRWIATAVVAAGMCLSVSQCLAQDDAAPGGQGGRRGGFGGGGRGNFDPAQMQQMYLERLREDLEVKEDDEWKALEPVIRMRWIQGSRALHEPHARLARNRVNGR